MLLIQSIEHVCHNNNKIKTVLERYYSTDSTVRFIERQRPSEACHPITGGEATCEVIVPTGYIREEIRAVLPYFPRAKVRHIRSGRSRLFLHTAGRGSRVRRGSGRETAGRSALSRSKLSTYSRMVVWHTMSAVKIHVGALLIFCEAIKGAHSPAMSHHRSVFL